MGRDVPVVAAETVGADDPGDGALDEGRVATLPGIASVAKSRGRGVPLLGRLRHVRRETRIGWCVRGGWRPRAGRCACVSRMNIGRLVEPACGAALAAVYSGECEHLEDVEGPVIVEVCGGAIVDRKTMEGTETVGARLLRRT